MRRVVLSFHMPGDSEIASEIPCIVMKHLPWNLLLTHLTSIKNILRVLG